MTQASIVATDIGTLLYAHPGVVLGALGMLAGGAAASVAAGASVANLSAGAGLSDPAFAALVSAAIGVAALLTLLTTQRFLRRRQARAGAAGTSSQYCPQNVSGSAVSTIAATLQRSTTPRRGNDPAPDEVLQKDV